LARIVVICLYNSTTFLAASCITWLGYSLCLCGGSSILLVDVGFLAPNCSFCLVWADTGRRCSFLLSVDLVDIKLLWKEATFGVIIFWLLCCLTREECCLRLKLSMSVSFGTFVSYDKLTSNLTFLLCDEGLLVTVYLVITFCSSLLSVLVYGFIVF
jgi:hypothetical protein